MKLYHKFMFLYHILHELTFRSTIVRITNNNNNNNNNNTFTLVSETKFEA